VASGILGVALIQALLAGLGFLVAGVPAAGLLTLVCLVFGVIQLGVVIVLIPVVIYLFSTADTVTAVGFLIWAILVAPVDNILKPLLLGRGVDVPMLIIFVGAIGGFLNAGIIGLFIGAVVLALGYNERLVHDCKRLRVVYVLSGILRDHRGSLLCRRRERDLTLSATRAHWYFTDGELV
jgi:predicted PurR-regulated permease PerM